MIRQITFQGREFILIGDTDGAITTREAYSTGRVSYAHLLPDGNIIRYQKKIGTREDATFGEPVAVELDPEEIAVNLFDADEWAPPDPPLEP